MVKRVFCSKRVSMSIKTDYPNLKSSPNRNGYERIPTRLSARAMGEIKCGGKELLQAEIQWSAFPRNG